MQRKSKFIILFSILLTSCQSLPQFFTAAEEIATDTAIKAEVSREAIQKDTNVDLNIKIYNKDIPNAIEKR